MPQLPEFSPKTQQPDGFVSPQNNSTLPFAEFIHPAARKRGLRRERRSVQFPDSSPSERIRFWLKADRSPEKPAQKGQQTRLISNPFGFNLQDTGSHSWGRRALTNAARALALCCLFSVIIPDTPVLAGPPIETAAPPAMSELVSDTALILRGVVTDIAFSQSESDKIGSEGLPLTIVTWKVEEVLRGRLADGASTFSLRFVGGLSRADGRVMLVNGIPFFRRGDRDILFVANPDARYCPLMGCADGRYRIVYEQVFGDMGEKISLTGEDPTLTLGAPQLGPDVLAMVIPAASPEMIEAERTRIATAPVRSDPGAKRDARRRLQEMSAPRVFSRRVSEVLPGATPVSIDLAAFEDAVRRAASQLDPPAPVAGIDPATVMSIPAPQPEDFTLRSTARQVRPETREQLLYERSGRNPVLSGR